mmetsp:Transcript_36707/g.92323  ORF Transcript_36707/g.92323 Transcript_36707/m.92323 type:complete len:201 (-) Transcript_36707:1074-1676(-)
MTRSQRISPWPSTAASIIQGDSSRISRRTATTTQPTPPRRRSSWRNARRQGTRRPKTRQPSRRRRSRSRGTRRRPTTSATLCAFVAELKGMWPLGAPTRRRTTRHPSRRRRRSTRWSFLASSHPSPSTAIRSGPSLPSTRSPPTASTRRCTTTMLLPAAASRLSTGICRHRSLERASSMEGPNGATCPSPSSPARAACLA